ncbi:hypothetical protein ACVIJ6_004813 [Bradyrhizobium sp. USDA 4369]
MERQSLQERSGVGRTQARAGSDPGRALPKPDIGTRLLLRMSVSETVDGVWVGSTEDEPHPGRARVVQALQLIRERDPINHARITRQLKRIWIDVIASGRAHYDQALEACVIDRRYLSPDTTTIEQIASTIVHEATHARLYYGDSAFNLTFVVRRRRMAHGPSCPRRHSRSAASRHPARQRPRANLFR